MTSIPSYITFKSDASAPVIGIAGKHGAIELSKDKQTEIAHRIHEFMKQDSVKLQLRHNFGIGEHKDLKIDIRGNGDVYVVGTSGNTLKLREKIPTDILSPVNDAKRHKDSAYASYTGHVPAPHMTGVMNPPLTHTPPMHQMAPAQFGGAPVAPPPGFPGGYMPPQYMPYPMMPMMYPMMAPPMMYPSMPMMGGYPSMPMMGGYPQMCPPFGSAPYVPQRPPEEGSVEATLERTGHVTPSDHAAITHLLQREQAAQDELRRVRAEAEARGVSEARLTLQESTDKLTLLREKLVNTIGQTKATIAFLEEEKKAYAPGYLNINRITKTNRRYYDEEVIPKLEHNKAALEKAEKDLIEIDALLKLPKEPRQQREKLLQLEARNKQLEEELARANAKRDATSPPSFHSGYHMRPSSLIHTGRAMTRPSQRVEEPEAFSLERHTSVARPKHVTFADRPIMHPLHTPAPPMDDDWEFTQARPIKKEGRFSLSDIQTMNDTDLIKYKGLAREFLSSTSEDPFSIENAQLDLANIEAEIERRAKASRTAPKTVAGPADRRYQEIENYTLGAIRANLPVQSWDSGMLSQSINYLNRKMNNPQTPPHVKQAFEVWHQALSEERQRRHFGRAPLSESHHEAPRTAAFPKATPAAVVYDARREAARALHHPQPQRPLVFDSQPIRPQRPDWSHNRSLDSMNGQELIEMWHYYDQAGKYWLANGMKTTDSSFIYEDAKKDIEKHLKKLQSPATVVVTEPSREFHVERPLYLEESSTMQSYPAPQPSYRPQDEVDQVPFDTMSIMGPPRRLSTKPKAGLEQDTKQLLHPEQTAVAHPTSSQSLARFEQEQLPHTMIDVPGGDMTQPGGKKKATWAQYLGWSPKPPRLLNSTLDQPGVMEF